MYIINNYIRTVLNCRSSALDSKPLTGELKRATGGLEVFFFSSRKSRFEIQGSCRNEIDQPEAECISSHTSSRITTIPLQTLQSYVGTL